MATKKRKAKKKTKAVRSKRTGRFLKK